MKYKIFFKKKKIIKILKKKMTKINFFLPYSYNFLLFKKKKKNYCFIFNKNIFFSIFVNINYFYFEKISNSILFLSKKKKWIQEILKLEIFLKRIILFYKVKIKFKGKGLKIIKYKKKKIFKLFFGKSHITFFLYNKILLKKIKKYKFIILGTDKKKLTTIKQLLLNIKPINLYTKRGLRYTKSLYFKRISKKISYR